MSQKTPTVAGKQLSSSLKERLKRCGRYHSSPKVTTPATKQLKTGHLIRNIDTDSSNKSSSESETPAKKKCHSSQSAETRVSVCVENRGLSTPFSTPNVKSQGKVDKAEAQVNRAVTNLPLSELQGNPDLISISHTLQRTENERVAKPLDRDIQADCNIEKKLETFQHGELSTTDICNTKVLNNTDFEKDSGETIKKSVKNHNFSSESTEILDSPKLNSRLTPLTSRSSTRMNSGRVSKLDFESDIDFVSDSDKSAERVTAAHSYANDIPDCTVNKTKLEVRGQTATVEKYEERQRLLKEISEKEEILRQLKMVKMYRAKNNLMELQCLIDKWRGVSQQGLQDLYEALPEPKPSLTEILQHLGVDHELIQFDPLEETLG